jgi:hypothetical protein
VSWSARATSCTGIGRLRRLEVDYQVPFGFTGKLNKLTVKLGPEELTPAEHEMIYGMKQVTK